MTKFKVGDKVKRTGSFGHPFNDQKVYTVTFVSERYISVEGVSGEWLLDNFRLSTEWTIYNNTKPLSELSDEQRGLLFNYHFNGGVIVSHASAELKSPTWGADVVYRAKQKSERELFIDLALASCDAIKLLKGDNVTLLEAMFDAGFKAPEDKQC